MPVEGSGAYLERVATSDLDALRALFALAAPTLNGMLIALLRDTAAADSVLEDLFARLPLKLRDQGELALADPDQGGHWLGLQARELAIARLRRDEEMAGEGEVPQLPSIGAAERLTPASWGRLLSAAQIRALLRAWYRGLSSDQLARLAHDEPATFRAGLGAALLALQGLSDGEAALPGELPSSTLDVSPQETLAAADYVLGLPPSGEWRQLRKRYRLEPAFRRAAIGWAARFAPLDAGISPLPPRADLLARIEARIAADALPAPSIPPGAAPSLAEVPQPRSPLFMSLGMAAGFGVVGVLFGVLTLLPPSAEASASSAASFLPLTTRLSAPGGAPVFEAHYDPVTGLLEVARIAGQSPQRADSRAYELWLALPGARPRSLGIIEEAGLRLPVVLAPGMTLAVSLEPQGGSPLWGPSGAIISASILAAP